MSEKTIKELLTAAENSWQKVLVARRKAVVDENEYKEALLEWYKQQEEEPSQE